MQNKKRKLINIMFALVAVFMLCCSFGLLASKSSNILCAEAAGSYNAESYTDIYDLVGDGELLAGKTVSASQVVSRDWIESTLAQENGVEFKLTVSEDDWNNWGTNFLWIEYTDYCDLRIFRAENGISLWFQYWNGGEAFNGYADYTGDTLVGVHTIKVTNVNASDATSSKQSVYVDGILIGMQEFPFALKGFHLRIHNNTGREFKMASAAHYYRDEVCSDAYDWFTANQSELLVGKTLAAGQNVERTWVESALAQENGVEFKLTVSEADWNNWGTNFLWVEYAEFCDLRIFKSETGGVSLWFQYWNGGEAFNGYADADVSLAGTHTIKITNVGMTGLAISKQSFYVDGELIGEQVFPFALKGYHLRVHNNTGRSLTIATASEFNGETALDACDMFVANAKELFLGKTLTHGQNIERTWIESVLAQENGIEFTLTIAQEDWDNWGTNFLWVEYAEFCDLRIFRSETGGVSLWFQYWNGGEAFNGYADADVSLAGTHIIKVTNVGNDSIAMSKQSFYVDGEFVGEQVFPYALKGYHLRVHNNTGRDLKIATASYEFNDEVYADAYDWFTANQTELLIGKTLAANQTIERTWVDSILAQENGIEFTLTIAQEDWDNWGTNFLWVEYAEFCDLRIFRSETGGVSLWFQYWNGGEAFNGHANADVSLAGTHIIKVTNVGNDSIAMSKQSFYVDGELVGEQVFPYALKGYHLRVHNNTGRDLKIATASYEFNDEVYADAYDWFTANQTELLVGKTIAANQTIERTWVESVLAQENGIEFTLTIAQEDWDNWGTNFLWLEYAEFCDLRIFRSETGGTTLWFQYWFNNVAYNGYAYSDVSLAGTHVIKITNVNLIGAVGSKQCFYVDDVLIGEQAFPYVLKGYHLRIHNNTGRDLKVATASYEFNDEVYADVYDWFAATQLELLVGKTISNGEKVQVTWVDSILAQENGVEFTLTIAQEDWDNWGSNFLWIEYVDFCDLRIFRSETGGTTLWFQYWFNNVAYNGYAYSDVSLAGTHVIKITNVNLVGVAGSKQSFYVDDTLIGEQAFPFMLKGYHFGICNNTGRNLKIATASYEFNDEAYADAYDWFINNKQELLVGKTLNSEQVVEQTWVEASLAQENGVEFKINIAPTDWDGFGEGFIWVEYNDFCDLRIFRSQTGGISLWFQYWNGGVSYNGYADADISLAGTHVIRVANVNLAGKAISKQSVYVDGTLIGEQVFPYALKGYHLRVHNKTSKSFVISSNMSYTEESPVQDICDCFGNAQIAAGTTLGHQERVGVSTDITSNKTIEFSLTVSQEDWDNWGGNFLWISIGYLDLRIFNLEAASPGSGDGLSFWFQYWINGEAINVFAQSEGTTFAGTHTIRISLVNGTALSPASKTMVYVDGNIVAIQYATSYVNGVNINIENQTTRALSVASEAYYAIALNVLGETQYTVVNKGEDFVLPSVSEQDYIIVGWKDGENILAVGETVSSVRNLEAIAVLASAEMGASVRITEEAAIRWKFSVSKESYQYLIDTFGAENVKFTLELETDRSDVKQTREVTTWSEIYEGKYTCVAVYKGIKSNHYGWSFIARLYVTITCNGKTYTVYILENDNLRTPSEVACRAYYDRQDEYGGDYINLTKDGDYSPYDSTQLGVLATYFTVVNVQNNVVSIPDVDGAHKYVVEDDNSNIQSVVLYAGEDLAYTSDVVGEHNVNIKIYDSNDELLKVAKATFNVKPIWAYSNISNGAYYLTAEIAENYGAVLTQNQAYYNGYYYYNVEDKKYYDDSSKATEMLSFETLQEYKDCGFNVISLDTSYMTDYTGTPNANPIISYQRFNEIMDMAWSIGLKVIISDNYLINTSAQNQDSNGNGLYNNTANGYTVTKQWIKDCYRDMLSKFVTHKAFYGVNLWDEPGNGVIGGSANNRIKAVCEASCLINEIMQEDYPGIYCYQVCSLFPIVGSDYDKYYEYVEYMAKNSAVDHLIADTYMYTIYSIFDEKHYRESFDDTYEVMSEISKDYGKDMAICLTAFDFNESRGTHALTQYDVLVNTYYALAHDVEGFPYFIYWDFVAYGQEQITGCCVNKDGEKTAVYGYVQKAISEAKIITNLLEGYDYYARESLRIGYTSNAGVKTTLYNGKDDSYAYCWVNMAKEGSSSVVTVTINAGETYYLGTVKHVASEDIQIEVEPGQMLIEFANKEV